jgi:hypothetical protein
MSSQRKTTIWNQAELKAALHEHTERLRKVAAAKLASIVKPAP